jgi:hypothetical protein
MAVHLATPDTCRRLVSAPGYRGGFREGTLGRFDRRKLLGIFFRLALG